MSDWRAISWRPSAWRPKDRRRLGPPAAFRQRCDYLQRLAGTAFSFSLFGIGSVVLAVVVLAPLNLVVADQERRGRLARGCVQWCFAAFVRTMIVLGVIDFETTDAAALEADRGRLVIANHPSLIDVVLIISLMQRTQCIVKHQHWRNPFLRSIFAATGYIRNDEDPHRLIDDCVRALAAGNNLIVFPEGTRTVPGRSRVLQRGFANIAVAAGAEIRLLTIRCIPTTLTRGEKWYEIPPSRPRFTLSVHEIIDAAAIAADSPPSIAARRLTRHVAQRFAEVLDDARA